MKECIHCGSRKKVHMFRTTKAYTCPESEIPICKKCFDTRMKTILEDADLMIKYIM